MKTLTLPAHLESLPMFQAFIEEEARAAGFQAGRIDKIALAAEEALVNIFNYAYPEGAKGDVRVSCRDCGDGAFCVRFEDQGRPFNMLSAEDPEIAPSVEEQGIGGLGIFFIKQMTDAVEYERKETDNILTFKFNRK